MAKIDVADLQEQIRTMNLVIVSLITRIEKLEAGAEDNGIYLEGSPDFVQEYYRQTKEVETARLKPEVAK